MAASLTCRGSDGQPLRYVLRVILNSRRLVAGVAVVASAVLAACGDGEAQGDAGQAAAVVVTTPVLGAVVRDLLGDAADVDVLMPEGLDPHDWEPSAKDIEAVTNADVVVANGLGLEESLEGALDEASAGGTTVFFAGDHIESRRVGDHEATDEHDGDDEDEDEDGNGAIDPHFWTDPVAMHDAVVALAPVLIAEGIDVGTRAGTVADGLVDLDSDVAGVLAAVPANERRLVTGHESLGYFADRYGFEIVGAVVPSASSLAETSAGELAELADRIEEFDVEVVFTELGTPTDVVDAIASETGVRVVELATHTLPDDGTYRTFVLDLATAIATALR